MKRRVAFGVDPTLARLSRLGESQVEGTFKKLHIHVQSAKLAPAEFLKEFVDSIQGKGA